MGYLLWFLIGIALGFVWGIYAERCDNEEFL